MPHNSFAGFVAASIAEPLSSTAPLSRRYRPASARAAIKPRAPRFTSATMGIICPRGFAHEAIRPNARARYSASFSRHASYHAAKPSSAARMSRFRFAAFASVRFMLSPPR